MRLVRMCIVLFVLALLASSTLAMDPRPVHGVGLQVEVASSDRAVERLPVPGDTHAPGQSSVEASPVGLLMPPPPVCEWHIECVDCPKYFGGTNRSLGVDAAGRPHIAYGGDHLYHAWHDGASWHYETVDGSRSVGSHASLALDGSGHPHISYVGWSDLGLNYAWHDGTGWRIETADSGGWCQYTSLALDGSGQPHISYHVGYPDYDLKHAWRDAGGWHTETVDGGTAGWFSSLVLDGSGHPHISHVDLIQGVLRYAWYDGASWQTEPVVSVGYQGAMGDGFSTSLVLDSSGRPHISSYHDAIRGLLYSWRDGSGWHTELVDRSPTSAEWAYVGRYSSLALDGLGRPHILYGSLDDVKHAWRDASGWHSEKVAKEGRYSFISLALDAAGGPHVSYFNDVLDDDDTLEYAWHDGKGWRTQVVDVSEHAGQYVSLALSGEDRPSISYLNDYGNDLKYAWHDGTAWHVRVLDSVNLKYTSLAVDGLGRPHVSYYDGTQGILRYAWHDGTKWRVEAVDRDCTEGIPSLALDQSNRPHISYYGNFRSPLMYAWRDESGWHRRQLSHEGFNGNSSLALDGSDRPHIGYGGRSGRLYYTWHDGQAWQTEVIPAWGYYISLALDRTGQPHVASPTQESGFVYSWRDGSGWHTEEVGAEERASGYPSLRLDGADRPHVSYLGTKGRVQYTWYDGETWWTQVVDTATGSVSLALDGNDWPRIGYGDDGDLKYAWCTPPSLVLDKQAAPHDGLYNGDPLTYSLALSGPGLSARLWDPLPESLRYVPGSITGTITPTAVYNPAAHAIAWQGRLSSDPVQTIYFQVTPLTAATRLLTGPLPVANVAWLTDTYYQRTVSATATVDLWPPALTLHKQARPADGLRNNGLLTYTLTLSAPDLNVHLWDPLPPPVHYVPGSITGTVTPAATYSPTARAIVWQGTLLPDVAQTVRFQVTLGVTGTGSLSLSLPIVNTAWLTVTENGRSVSAASIVNGRHVYLPLVVRGS
jgi:hypothetical protein